MKSCYTNMNYLGKTTGKPTTWRKLKVDRGCGYILMQLSSRGPLTRKDVYTEGRYAGRYGEGYHSLLWTALIENGMVEPINGWFVRTKVACFGGYVNTTRVNSFTEAAPKYRITPKGMAVLACIKK